MSRADIPYVPWKRYTLAVSQAILVFTLASFLLGFYIMHPHSLAVSIAAGLLYAVIVVYSIYRMVREFSLAAVMLMIPIAPLVVLIIVVSLVHLLQVFNYL